VAKRKKTKKKEHVEPMLHQETKDSIVAVIALLLAALLIFAAFGLAGKIGEMSYTFFDSLLGKGYFIFPLSLVMIGTALLFSIKQKNISLPLIGASIFLTSSLSLADIIFGARTGGLIGYYLSRPLLYLFDSFASGLIFASLLVISVLIIFNASLRRIKKDKDFEMSKQKELLSKTIVTPEPPEVAEESEEIEEIIESVPEPEVEQPPKDERKNVAGVSPEVMKELKRKATNYLLPPLNLLDGDRGKPSAGDIKGNGNIIQRTLAEFGIPVEMGEVNVGPSVTQYTLKPAQGIKLSRIIALHNDLALALAAHPLRIEAPIPGKSFVGIEVPNKAIAFVGLRKLLENEDYQKGGPLTFALGKNVAGRAMYADLARMPHLLVAGSTGSGKSVCIHSILMSLLYKNTPLSLRLLLIDPKRVELAHYSDVPHLLTPVITEARESISALRWAVKEMENRYRILQGARRRDIISYNSAHNDDFMPYIVIIIDELADLMTAYGREVEASIVRIAQMARAVGIHLIVSTQRPSVEVITGLIKANITSRIAFQVASQIDSRTILDGAGAEKMLGNGDMLFLSGDSGKPKRIQGGFVSEPEVKKVTDFILNQDTEPEYLDDVVATKANGIAGDFDDGNDDELYESAYSVVIEAQKASTSYLQRRLKIGYARAARLMDMLEERGVVGPGEGAKPREILEGGNVTEQI
jgi:DNA segregation ATPase FtsK/SpoIIIE, S-DNA-T family